MFEVPFKHLAARISRKGVFRHTVPPSSVGAHALGLHVLSETWLETEDGWEQAGGLKAGHRVACLGGAFAKIKSIEIITGSVATICIPGGALGASSALHLPDASFVGFAPPRPVLYDAPFVSLPASALHGYCGIGAGQPQEMSLRITLQEEEMIWSQTGLLLHAPTRARRTFYKQLNYGETRALLAVSDPKNARPDPRRSPNNS